MVQGENVTLANSDMADCGWTFSTRERSVRRRPPFRQLILHLLTLCIDAAGLTNVKHVAAGDSFGILITTSGDVYTVGCGHFGALGHGDEKSLCRPKKLIFPGNVRIVAAAGGSFHALFVSEDGKVFATGKNDCGQTGIAGKKQFTSPTLVEALTRYNIEAVACGKLHSVAVAVDGTILTMGCNEQGQLGVGLAEKNIAHSVKIVEIPTKLLEDGKPIQVCAKAFHTIVLFESGVAFCWGSQTSIWHETTGEQAAMPISVKVPNNERVTAVACGTNMSGLITESGKVLTWGEALYGKIGRLKTTYYPAIVESVTALIGASKPTKIDAGSNSTIILFS